MLREEEPGWAGNQGEGGCGGQEPVGRALKAGTRLGVYSRKGKALAGRQKEHHALPWFILENR